jgi:acetyl/propionyl-CoA carboxylase alpha subunit
VITKLLVANRGEIARRIIRSAHAMGIASVAVCSDADAGAPHAADAVHPGYGFLSEDAAFARACVEAGLIFVGPPPEVIEAMGSKLAAKATMAGAGVPVLPTVRIPHGTGEGEQAEGGLVEGSLDEGGPIENRLVEGDLVRAATELGFPVLVKASAGGGGRGMRVVERPDDLADAVSSAAREAHSAFGDGTVFLEPYIARPRHVEVQIIGDVHGTVVHLFERECSIQRRHQKIVEECPSPAVTPELRTEMCTTAVAAAHAIGYVGAGTVEFLLLPDGSFAFLEVNTRLQVEHPVTEFVTGLDLVRLQLLVAEGQPLPPEVLDPPRRGHAIEVRLYAEDPARSWQPSAGHLHRFSVTGGPAVRVDSGVEDGSEVSPYYDPMLAKVIAHGETREEAARTLARALDTAQIHGVTTNRDLLVRILRHPEFLRGDIDTGFLQRHDPAELGRPKATPEVEQVHALAAALAAQAERRRQAPVLGGLPSGWRNIASQMQTCAFVGAGDQIDVGYRFDRDNRCTAVTIDGAPRPDIEVLTCDVDAAQLSVNGVIRHYQVHRVGTTAWIDGPDGSSTLAEVPRFALPGSQLAAGALVAPLPGTVVKVAVSIGDAVHAGDTLIAIEAMKMEHEVRSAVGGTVTEIHVAAGEQVEAGRLLVVLQADDDDG